MIAFLFHRESRVVQAMEAAGLLLLAGAVLRIGAGHASTLAAVLFLLDVALYAFIKFCAVRRWYPGAPRCAGIELQFVKAMVPTSYILPIAMAWFLAAASALPLGIAACLLAVVAHVNVILLVFHRRDRDPTPVNAYSRPHAAPTGAAAEPGSE
jgi:hypothetical protein